MVATTDKKKVETGHWPGVDQIHGKHTRDKLVQQPGAGVKARSANWKAPAPTETVQLAKLDKREFRVRIVGVSPLLCSRFSEKAKQQIKDKEAQKAKSGRGKRDPEAEYRASLYPYPDGGFGFPSIAFKKAMVRAAKPVVGMTMVDTRSWFHVLDDLVKIDGTPRMHEAMVRLKNGAADIRYRAEFPEWSCTLRILYNAAYVSPEQLVNLLQLAGFHVGVGEHRVERDGDNGMFEVGGQE